MKIISWFPSAAVVVDSKKLFIILSTQCRERETFDDFELEMLQIFMETFYKELDKFLFSSAFVCKL